MYHKIVPTPLYIASCSSVRPRVGLLLQNKLQVNAASGLIARRNNQVRVQLTDSKWCGVKESPYGSTPWCTGLSAYKSSGSFDVDKRNGINGVGRSILQPTVITFGVPCRTFRRLGRKDKEGTGNPSLLARKRNKLFPPNPTSTEPTAFLEKLNPILKDLPPSEANKIKVTLADEYIAANLNAKNDAKGRQSRFHRWLLTVQRLLGIAILSALLIAFFSGPASAAFSGGNFGKGNRVVPEAISITFDDVKGVDEAKSELQDVVEFLRNPEMFEQLRCKLPKGILLVGRSGTGKTLLARAVAGEAGVPFFHIAGPECDEMFVEPGARRVHNVFKAAKAQAPCVVFVDEIDYVKGQRFRQLLSEMDGLRHNEGVFVLAATNDREDLDDALVSSGRFDVEVQVPAPDLDGRRDILEHYLSKIELGDDVDVDSIARRTDGLTGADLENIVNRAAVRAAITEGADCVASGKQLEFALNKIVAEMTDEVESEFRIPNEETNWNTAYHESGHALVAHYTKDADPVREITIVRRGNVLGYTDFITKPGQYDTTRSQLLAELDILMAGRAAEELAFGAEKVTAGATDDLEEATSIATAMVKRYGMSEKVGLRSVGKELELSPGMSELIDKEIKRILQESYERARKILHEHRRELQALAEALMKYGKLGADEYKAVIGKARQVHETYGQ